MDPAGGIAFGAGLVVLGLVMALVGSAVGRGTISRNSAVGIRTRATQSSDQAWQAGHRAAAPWLYASAAVGVSVGVVSIALSATLAAQGRTSAAVLVVPLGGAVVAMAVLVWATLKADGAARSIDQGSP